MQPTLSLVIPAYNEALQLEATVLPIAEAFEAGGIVFELIIVDNGSIDETSVAAKHLAEKHPTIRLVRLEKNAGKGGGILEGIRHARGAIFGWADADDQVRAGDIVRVYQGLTAGVAMAKPKRIMRTDSAWRRAQSGIYNVLFRILFAVPYSDINGPPKFITKEAFERIQPKQTDWFLDAECIIKLARLHMPIAEVTVEWNSRSAGASKIRLLTILEFLKNMVQYRLRIK